MRWRMVWSVGLLALLPAALAASAAETVKEKMQAILSEKQTIQQELAAKFRDAATDEERAKIREELAAVHTKYVNQLVDLAAKNLRDEAAFEVLQNAVGPQFSLANHDKAFELLAKEFVQHEKIGQLVATLIRTKSPAAEAFVRAVAEKNTDNATKGTATFVLAVVLRNKAETSGAPVEELKKAIGETKKLLQVVIDEYPDVTWTRGKLGVAAKAELALLNKISVGEVHPEIEGEDTDGKAFKLSDYRGKVIFLDFWGHW